MRPWVDDNDDDDDDDDDNDSNKRMAGTGAQALVENGTSCISAPMGPGRQI